MKSIKNKANIFNTQHFSIHDGPGIRTIVFFKGCPLSCKWCSNPESQDHKPQLMIYRDRCVGCGFCKSVCPVSLNRSLCDNCGKCTEKCYSESRKIVGKYMSPTEVEMIVKKDIEFYKQSDGGVTFSGGEPLLWPNFIEEIGRKCHAKGINTVVETCGYVPWESFDIIEKVIDLVYYDIKIFDDSKHEHLCGVSNRLIFKNLIKIANRIQTVVRIPIIPGINDDDSDINDVVTFLAHSVKAVAEVHLLPYHNMGAGKYDALGIPYELESLRTPDNSYMNNIKSIFERKGLKAKIGG